MDPKEWKERSVGIPLDPEKQKDPEEEGERVPAEGRKEVLNDITEQHGGQRTEVGVPFDGSGDVQRGQRTAFNEKSDRQKKR
jgi:hypothetical protein